MVALGFINNLIKRDVMNKHLPYEKRFNRKCDFMVEYNFISNQFDYQVKLSQGMRSDFCYKDDEKEPTYMIWPEFENANGEVIEDKEATILNHGKARMWVMLDEQRKMHKERLVIGQEGYLVAGSHKIAKVTVLELVGLKDI